MQLKSGSESAGGMKRIDAVQGRVRNLASAVGAVGKTGFTPQARYLESMDFLIYLKEDVSYRADRVDSFLTVFWHPQEDRLVGIKLKGFRFLFQRVKDILELKETDFLPLVKALKIALVAGMAEWLMEDVEKRRKLESLYRKAQKLAVGIEVSPDEWKQ